MDTDKKLSNEALSEPLQQCNVSSSAYIDLAKFINKSHERRFNDALMKLIIIEIQLKSFYFNENMILPSGSVTDNCGWIEICVTETVTEAVNCGDWTITRTFSAKDKQGNYVVNSPRTGTPNTAACTQVITVRKPDFFDVSFPPFTTTIECDEDFPTLANGNPSPEVTGYPFVTTAFGIHDINETYCNLAAQYADQPRIVVCEGGYKLLRNWTFFDWCNPGFTIQFIQIIKVGDFTAPEIECPVEDYNWDGVADLPTYSTGPFNCTASSAVPNPVVTDNCSDWTVLTQIVTTVQVPVYNQWGQQIGTEPQVVVVATIPHGGNRFVSNIPIGCHRFRYTATDGCGNVATIECDFQVEDQVEPRAVCDDDLNISVGGQGIGRVYAEDIDEGSNDNYGPNRVEIRRRYTQNPNTCAPVSTFFGAEENGALPWGDYVDFTCCDVHSEVRIELRVWVDRNGDGIPGNTIAVTDCWGQTRNVTDNSNICWLDVLVEDKINPVCIPPHPVAIDCDDVPYDFNPLDTLQMQELFGEAEAADNCPGATIREVSPIVNLHDCGFGSITRRFEARDLWGNLSGICTQAIQIREVHNYEIKFPADVEGICGPLLFDTVIALEPIELARPGPSYTVDTLRALRATAPGSEFALLVGADAARELPQWHQANALPTLATLVIFARPGAEVPSLPWPHQVVRVPAVGISATEIRARVAAGRSIRYWVPDAVAEYISASGLYLPDA